MKPSGSVARRYAKALFQVAVERNIVEKVARDLSFMNRLLEENPALRHYLNSPDIPRREKEAALETLFADQFCSVFFNFLLILLRKHRQDLIPQIAREFGIKRDEYQNRVRAIAVTAVPVSREIIEALEDHLSRSLGKEVQVIPRVDPSILGGIRLNINGKIYDGSLIRQLHRMRNHLLS